MDPSLHLVLSNNFKELRNTTTFSPKPVHTVTVPPRIDLRLNRDKPLQRNLAQQSQTEQFLTDYPSTRNEIRTFKGNNEHYTSPMSIKQTNSYVPELQGIQSFMNEKMLQVSQKNSIIPQPSPFTFHTQNFSIIPYDTQQQNSSLGIPPATNIRNSSGTNIPFPPSSLPQQASFPMIESGSKAGFHNLPPGTNFKDRTTKSAYYSTDVQKHYINIDTRYRNNTPVTSTTNFRWRFFQPMKNIISLRIASVEIPNNAYAFSAAKQNITFEIKLSSSPTYTTITIPEGNYNSSDLEETINILIQEVDEDFLFDINLVTGKSTFTNSTKQFNIIFPRTSPTAVSDWGIGFNLGFTQPSYSNKTTITSEQVVYIIGDIYYFLKIGDFDGIEHNREGQTRVAATAKIIATADKYSMIIDNGSNFMTKQVDFSSPQNIASFDVKIIDSNNNTVDLLGGNWSCTLELVEVLNSELYTGYSDNLLKNYDTPR